MMKLVTYKSLFIFPIFLLLYNTGFSGNLEEELNVEKKKTFNQTYTLHNNSSVEIKNSFGSVNVNHWKENTLKVNISITARANSDAAAQAILDAISIIDHNGSTISLETRIENKMSKNNNQKSSRQESMSINYEIYLPESTPLKITNSFGPTHMPSRSGRTELTQSFGDLTTGHLTNIDNLSVEFGKLEAESLENTKVNLKFSKVNIQNLAGDFQGNFEFCTKPSIIISNKINNVNISNKYSDITIIVPDSKPAKYNIQTNFGKFVNKSNINFRNNDAKGFTKKYYTVTQDQQTSGSTKKITINSEFGTIELK